MKLLLDENLPHDLLALLATRHDVFTVAYMGWGGIANGVLLDLAAKHRFDALITIDRGYEHQQNIWNLKCAVILLLTPSNKITDIKPLVPQLLSTLDSLVPCTFVRIP